MTRALAAALFLVLIVLSFYVGRATASRPAPSQAYPESAWTRIGAPWSLVIPPSPRESMTPEVASGVPSPIPSTTARPSPTVDLRAAASVTGIASWYCLDGRSACTAGYPASGAYAAAGPALRAILGGHWRGRLVSVSAGGRSITVRLIDWCACGGGKLLDLYGSVFERLAPLSRGVLSVSVRW